MGDATDHTWAKTAGESLDLDRKVTAASPSTKPCFHGSRVSKNLSEPALSAGETSQFQPSGITSDVAWKTETAPLVEDGIGGNLNIVETEGLSGDLGMESPGGGIVTESKGVPAIEGIGMVSGG